MTSQYADRLRLANVVSRIKGDRNVPADALSDGSVLLAALFQTQTDDVWYIERRGEEAEYGYRVVVLRPNFTNKPSRDPVDHAQGRLMKEEFRACQSFVFDLPAEDVEDHTSIRSARRAIPELFRFGINQTLRDKRQVHSDGELLRVYDDFF